MSTFPHMAEIIPPGASGHARIEHFEVSQADSDFTRLRDAIGHSGEYVPPGKYARLMLCGDVMMSDTPYEQCTCHVLLRQATGRVLIAGLGLGMVLPPVLAKNDVCGVTVVEKSPDVIALVEPYVRHPKLRVVHGDIFTWKPPRGARYESMWFDIWEGTCGDYYPEMKKLRQRYRRYLVRGGWMRCWEETKMKLGYERA
jgi:hypothetical protein